MLNDNYNNSFRIFFIKLELCFFWVVEGIISGQGLRLKLFPSHSFVIVKSCSGIRQLHAA